MGKKHQKNKHLHVPAAFTCSKYHHYHDASTSSSLADASTKASLGVTEKLSMMRQDDAAREAKARKERQKKRIMRLRDRQYNIGATYGREEGGSVRKDGGMLEEIDSSDDDDDIETEVAALDLDAATMPSVPPEIRKVLNLGEVPVLSGLGRKRRTGHRRLESDVNGHDHGQGRAPPGPPPPKSWVTGDLSRSAMAGEGGSGRQKRSYKGPHRSMNGSVRGGRRYLASMLGQSIANSSRPRCYFGLKSQDPTSPAFRDLYERQHHTSEKLSCMVARQMARYWDELLEMEQYNLATLPARLKALLLGNIILHGPDVITIRTLQVLFLNRSELEDATGAEELTELDLSTLIGNDGSRGLGMSLKGITQKIILCRRIKEEDEAFPVLSTSSTGLENKSLQQDDTTPDSWDAEDNGTSNGNGISIDKILTTTRFTNLTRLSLAHPRSRHSNHSLSSSSSSFSSMLPPPNHWPDLLALTKRLPTLTHLSLAHWPKPTLTPNSHTAYVSINPKHAGAAAPGLSRTSIPHGGTHFYSAMDNDWTEAAGILRRLSANTYCLQYLNLDGCADWWSALVWPRATCGQFSAVASRITTTGVDWTGPWRQIHTLNLSSSSSSTSSTSTSSTSSSCASFYSNSLCSSSPAFEARTMLADGKAETTTAADLVPIKVVNDINRRRRAAGLAPINAYRASGGSKW